MTNDESELTRFRHGERVSDNLHLCMEGWTPGPKAECSLCQTFSALTAERDAALTKYEASQAALADVLAEHTATVATYKGVRSMLAGKIVETRREMRDGWSVPPEYMLDRIEILREIGKAVSK